MPKAEILPTFVGRIAHSIASRFRPVNYGRDYVRDWVSPEGKAYRERVFARQSAAGLKPLRDNPTFDEIRTAIDRHHPAKVLEFGCGWGRVLEVLHPYYDIEGCDVADEYLAKVPPTIPTFKLDILTPPAGFIETHRGAWDVLFCRGVMLAFSPDQMRTAMANLEQMAAKKVLIWEWAKVTKAMARAYPSPKFEYHPTVEKDE